MQSRIIIIGAGMTGLACARRLARAGFEATVLDKSRGIGGRMATRRVDVVGRAIGFDHGAQYFTAREPAFAAALDDLGAACARWDDGAAERHLVGVPGMSAVPRAMAAGLDVRPGTTVTAVRAVSGGWVIDVDAICLETPRLVLAIPAPQAAMLLGSTHPLHPPLAGIVMAPCLTLMAAFPGDTPRPFASRAAGDHPLSWIAHDGSKPGRGDGLTTWVAQARVAWSKAHLEASPDAIAALMLPMLAEAIGAAPGQAIYTAAHRWRYARTLAPLGQPFLRSADGSLHVGGDWCLGARVEAAWCSGTAIAESIFHDAEVAVTGADSRAVKLWRG